MAQDTAVKGKGNIHEAIENVIGESLAGLGNAKDGIQAQMFEYLSSHPSTRTKLLMANKVEILKRFRTPYARRKMKAFFDEDVDPNKVLKEVKKGLNSRVGFGALAGVIAGIGSWFVLYQMEANYAFPMAGIVALVLAAGLEVVWTSFRNHDKIILSQLTEGISQEEGSLIATGLVNMDAWPNVNAGVEDFHHFYKFLNHEYPKWVNEYLDKSGRKIASDLRAKLSAVKKLLTQLKSKDDMILDEGQIQRVSEILKEEQGKLVDTIAKTEGTLNRFSKHLKEIQKAANSKRSQIDKLLDTKEFLSGVRELVGTSAQLVNVAEEWDIVVSSQLGELVMENQLRIEEASDVLEGEIGRDLFHIEHDIDNSFEVQR